MKAFLNNITRKYYKNIVTEWTQPTLTENGTFGGSQMAVDWALGGHNAQSGVPYQAFAPNTGELYVYADEYKTWMKVFMYIPRPVRAKNITFSVLWVNSSSGPATNVKFYGGNSKDNNIELLKDIGNVGENETYSGTITTSNQYQYYTLYLENGGGGNNDSLDIKNISFSGESIEVVEGTASDYDFYRDKYSIKVPKIDNKYYVMKG